MNASLEVDEPSLNYFSLGVTCGRLPLLGARKMVMNRMAERLVHGHHRGFIIFHAYRWH